MFGHDGYGINVGYVVGYVTLSNVSFHRADLSVNASTGLGGCLSENIDVDGPYKVIGTGALADYQGITLDAAGNEATFSFLTFGALLLSLPLSLCLLC